MKNKKILEKSYKKAIEICEIKRKNKDEQKTKWQNKKINAPIKEKKKIETIYTNRKTTRSTHIL